MKKAFSLLAILATISASAQLTFKSLKGVAFNINFDILSSHFKEEGFSFDKAIKEDKGEECRDYYIFLERSSSKSSKDMINVSNECSDDTVKMYDWIKYLSRDEESFLRLRNECYASKATKESERVEVDGAVTTIYKDGNYTFKFIVDNDSNGKYYALIIQYDFSFMK